MKEIELELLAAAVMVGEKGGICPGQRDTRARSSHALKVEERSGEEAVDSVEVALRSNLDSSLNKGGCYDSWWLKEGK